VISEDGKQRPQVPKVRIFALELASPLGTLVAGATDEGVCLLEFGGRGRVADHFRRFKTHLDGEVVAGGNRHLAQIRDELRAYFGGTLQAFSVPLVMAGTQFEKRVWSALRTIPYGTTATYGDVARAIGELPAAARAVGRANGSNPIAIVIPCHRVIGKDRTLVGYGGGLWRKRRLLDLEGADRRLF